MATYSLCSCRIASEKGDGQQLAIHCLHRLLGLVGEAEDCHGQKFTIVIYTHGG